MIQRIQSVYLLVVTILLVVTMCQPVGSFIAADGVNASVFIPEFDIKSLSEILGHKNVSFTLNVYGSANLQQKVKCMNLLNDLL